MTDRQTDVLIVGGGAIGLSAAYFLHQRGIRCCILERREPGAGSSLRNAGYVSPSHFVPLASPGIIARGLRWMLNPSSPFYIKPRLDLSLLHWGFLFWRSSTEAHVLRSMGLLRDLCQAGLSLYEEMAHQPTLAFDLRKLGLLTLYRTDKGIRSGEEEAHLANTLGVDASLVDRTGLERLQPGLEFTAKGGLFFPGDAHLDPEQFIATMSMYLEAGGVPIHRETEVTGFTEGAGTGHTLHTNRGDFTAATVVLAGGAWSPLIASMLRLRLLLQAGKGYSMTIAKPPFCPTIPMILSESRVAITPFRTTLRFGGTMEIAGLDLSVTHRRVQAILDAVPRYLPGLETGAADPGQAWAGLRPVTPDGLPYLGRFRRFPWLIAATGHAMVGTTLAPISGKLVAELTAGEPLSFDIGMLAPDRFS